MASIRTEVPVFDLRIESRDAEAVADALRSGWVTMGPRTASRHCVLPLFPTLDDGRIELIRSALRGALLEVESRRKTV